MSVENDRCEGECTFDDLLVHVNLGGGGPIWGFPGGSGDDDYPPELDDPYPDIDPEPSQPDPQPDPQPEPDPLTAPSSAYLQSLADWSRQRALNSYDRAAAALTRHLDGRSSSTERAAVDAAIARWFPGASRATIAAIRDTIRAARAFLAGARFVGVASRADAMAHGVGAELAWDRRSPAWTDYVRNTVFIFPSYATYGAADRASILTHEGFHGAPEPASPYHSTSRVDHGERGGGALDNAYNYQGLTAELAGLPISPRMQGELARNRSR